MTIKLVIPVIIVLLILGAIIYYIFRGSNPPSQTSKSQSSESQNLQNIPDLSEITIEEAKITPPPNPILVNLYAPKQTKASGYTRLSQLAGQTLIQLKSDDTSDKIAFLFKGSCSGNGEIVYPLVSLVEGKSQTVWETNFSAIKEQLPLSLKVFKNAKNLKAYTRCADIKTL